MKPSILLHTKFLVPRRSADLLPRPHLIERLERQLDRRLILLSAPPGYGKTTLLAELATVTTLPYAWYQLDAADSDPTIFLSYLVECLRRVHAQVQPQTKEPFGSAAKALLDNVDSSTAVSPQRILTVLINELAETIEGDWLVIIEDYHLITNPAVHKLVDYLLENTPPGLHLLISTRGDPPLALARLRARGMLAELRTDDLRFNDDEIREWLARSIPGLPEQSARILNEKTEGWAAVLQIVLSSLSGKDPASARHFIASLSGTHRYIFEYLANEVFQQQPPHRQQFLMHTAVLSQMNAATCNALPAISNAQETLDSLQQENLFVVSLDEQGEWYRYHHLFREFLLGKLHREHPQQVITMEKAAAVYYESQGEMEAAFNHYLRGNDLESAARVIAAFAPDYVERGRVEVLQRYLSRLPDAVLGQRPNLRLCYGDVLRRLGQAGAAVSHYEDARAAFEAGNRQAGVCRALTRLAEVARSQGDYRRAQSLASEALQQAAASNHAERAGALMALAKCTGFLTGMDRGRTLAEEAIAAARQAGDTISPRYRANLLRSMGQICWWHGDPQATVRYCQEARQSVPDELSPIAANAFITMATPYLYWRDLDTALQCAERGLEMAQQLQLAELLPRAYATLGNVLTRRGESARAESCLRQAMELAQGLGLETYARVMATGFLAYNLYGQGRVDEARQLAESALWSHAGSPDTYEIYVCRSVLADIALENNQLDKAESLFESLLAVGQRRQFRIPLAMVYFGLAYIYLKSGRKVQGLNFATQALEHIEPTGALQLFLDQGERAGVVCQALWATGVRTPFVTQVLENLPRRAERPIIAVSDHSAVRVHCLGHFRVLVGDEEVTQERWVSAKARDLLAYFVTFRREHIPVERALDEVWPDTGGRGKTAFHTALYRLRSALRSEGQSTKFILVESGEYWLDAARFQIDVEEFDAAMAKARAARGDDEAAHWYEQALSLYQGEYLSNLLYQEWAMPERRRLNEDYLTALRSLATYRAGTGKYRSALALLREVLQNDPLREESHCEAMRYYACLGDRSGLVRQYRRLEAVLDEQLGVQPLLATQQLYQALLSQLDTTSGKAPHL